MLYLSESKQFEMKKFLFFFTVIYLFYNSFYYAQCNHTASFGSATVSGTCNGAVTISSSQWAGEYATLSGIVEGRTYRVNSSVTDDWVTIRRGTPGGTVVSHAVQGTAWAAVSGETYYAHISTNSSCGTQNSSRTTTVTLLGTGLEIANETAAITSNSACENGSIPLGSGAQRDVTIAANTWYDFVAPGSFAADANGFRIRPLNGTGNSGNVTLAAGQSQGAWFSGSTTSIRVSSRRSTCLTTAWTGTSATLTYRNTTPNAVTVTGGGNFCSGLSATLTASGGENGTVYWQNTTSGGTSTATPSTSQAVTGTGTYYFRSGNNGCWGTQGGATATSTAAPGTPATFPTNQWNYYAYNGGNIALSGVYSGFYSLSALNYDTRNQWADNLSPSNAAGFSGCGTPVPVDNHAVSAKRQGFPCGVYRIDVNNHDDDIQVWVNGSMVFEHVGCCDSHTDIWTGYLSSSSQVEVRHLEGVGGSHQGLNFTLVNPALNGGTIGGITDAAFICPNTDPGAFTNTGTPTGGTIGQNGSPPAPTYQWESSTTSAVAGWGNVPSATAITYDPGNLTATTWFRRKVTDACGTVAYSNVIQVQVRAAFSAGAITTTGQTICSGGDPGNITNQTLPSGGDGSYTYEWRAGSSPQAGSNSSAFDPAPGVTTTTTYTRWVRDNTCNTTFTQSTGSWVVIVNSITASGSIAAAQTICNGGDPAAFTSGDAATGSGTISYRWEWAENPFSSWNNIVGATAATYNAPAGLTATRQYRRIPVSLLNSVSCEGTPTATLQVTVQSVPTNGTIGSDQTICNGGDPALFTSGGAGTGDGSITYQWQSSVSPFSTWSDIGGATDATYDRPSGLTVTTQYRRQTVSTLNSVACRSTGTTPVQVTVQSSVTQGAIGTAQTICNGATPSALTSTTAGTGSGSIAYRWEFSTTSNSAGFSDAGATTPGFSPGALTQTTWYRRYTQSTQNSVMCESASPTTAIQITVQGVPTAGAIQTTRYICNNTTAAIGNVTAGTGSPGGGTISYRWEESTTGPASGFATVPSATANNYTTPNLTADRWYRRYTVYTLNSTSCESTSPTAVTQVDVQSVPTAGGITGGETICNGGNPVAFASSSIGGGDGSITYRWERADAPSFDSWTNIGASTETYDAPNGLTITRQYRRLTVSTEGGTACNSAPTNTVQVTVQAVVNAGAIAADQTICNGDTPAGLTSQTNGSGDGSIVYRWQSSTTSAVAGFANIADETASTFAPGALTQTTWYRRYTQSTLNDVMCESAASTVISVTVQDAVTAGAIAADQTICYNTAPATLTSSTDGTGSGSLTYIWEVSSTDAVSGFATVPSATASTLSPTALTSNRWYRRRTLSTQNTVECLSSYTSVVGITVRPQFTAGAIATTGETICTSLDPANIASVTPASGGDNSITYEWRANGNPINPSNSSNYDPAVNTVNVNTTFTRWAKDNTCNTTLTQSTGSWVVTINNPTTTTTLNNGDFVWTGSTSTVWNTNTNWLQRSGGNFVTPASAPNANTANVVIPASGTCISTNDAFIGANTVSVNNITIESGRTFNLNNASSVLNVAGVLLVNGTWGTQADGSTVVFNGSGAQTIPVLEYSNLSTGGGGTKSLAGNTTVNRVLTVGTSTTFNAGSHTLTLPFVGTPLVNNGTFNAGTGLVNYSGSGNQTLVGVGYNNLTISGSGNKTLGGATSVGSTLNLTAGTLVLGANTFTMNGSTINRTSGTINASNLGATLVFNNSSLLTLPTSVFSTAVNNLTLSNARVKAQSDFTVNGTLNLSALNPDATNGLLDLVNSYGGYAAARSQNSTDANNNLNSVVLTMGPNSSTTGSGDVTGKIRRTSISDGVPYTFGNANMILSFDQNGGTLPSQVTVVSTRGDYGLHVDKDGTADFTPGQSDTLIGNAAVKRLWQVLRTGGSTEVRFTVRFPYLDSELNGNTEADLVTWDHHIPYDGLTPHEHGKTSASTGDNYVELSNHGLFYLSQEGDASFTKYWMLSQKITKDTLWLGAAEGVAGNNWGSGINWTSGAIPANNTKVVIDPAVYKSELKVSGTRHAGSIFIKDNGVLNGENGTLIITGGPQSNGGLGSWVNQGTFNPGTSTVVFDNSNATLSGENKFYNLTINSGKALTIQANSIDTILNVLTNNGTLNASSNENTVIFAGENQYIPIPNGGPASYYNLTIAQQNSGVAIPEGDLDLRGTLRISEGFLDFEFDKQLDIKGDLIIDGTLARAMNVNMNGTSAQQIAGSNVNSFINLNVSGGSGTLTLNQDINVEGILNVEAGKTLNGGSKIIELRSPGDPWILDGSFTPGTSTVKYVSTDPTNINSTTYYNLESQGQVTKTANGNIVINNNLTLDESVLDMVSDSLTTKNLTILGSAQIEASDATIILTNSDPLTLPSGVFVSAVKHLTINGGGDVSSSGDLTLNGTLAMTNGDLDMGSNTLTMEPTSTWTSALGSLDATNAKIVFRSPTFAVGVLSSPVVKDLEFDRSTGINLTNNLEITGDFTLTDGTIDVDTYTLKLSGNMIHIDGAVDVDNGTIDFNNSDNWPLPATFFAGNAKNLKVSGNGGIGLGAPLKVSNTLELANGKIESSDANLLELGTGVNTIANVIWNNTSNARILGPVKRWYGTSADQSQEKGIIPVGLGDFNKSVQINFNQNTAGGYIMAEYISGLPSNNYDLPLTYFNSQGLRRYIQNADQTGYWSITPYDAGGNAYASMDDVPYKVRLRINQPSAVANGNNLPDPPTMRIIRAKGNPLSSEHEAWTIGTSDAVIVPVTPPSNSNFDYVVEATLTGFSWFNIGGDNSTPLPVELLSFSGMCTTDGNILKWKTASENQSETFAVERSRDGSVWTTISTVPAAGFSMQELSYQIVDQNATDEILYYRLRQNDINGDFKVYDPIVVTCGEISNAIITYPNPSGNQFSLMVSDDKLVGTAQISITDTKGSVVATKSVKLENGNNVLFFNENFQPGIYYITITNGNAKSQVIKHSIF